ncbi:hypothetical protein ZOSMA_2635G00020 [Zostera marina]|uniref:Uncharacterized protein n=1 Tax=Zostera marina TaxID=29655 RepID=A0A0K9PH75_ZOSMR|nr:hypothetical protein ZOSMA_2635G00020 [Zostera marina]
MVRRLVRRHPSTPTAFERRPSTHTSFPYRTAALPPSYGYDAILAQPFTFNPTSDHTSLRKKHLRHPIYWIDWTTAPILPYLNALAGIDFHHHWNNPSTDFRID